MMFEKPENGLQGQICNDLETESHFKNYFYMGQLVL